MITLLVDAALVCAGAACVAVVGVAVFASVYAACDRMDV